MERFILKEFPLPQALDSERRASGGENMDSKGIRQALL